MLILSNNLILTGYFVPMADVIPFVISVSHFFKLNLQNYTPACSLEITNEKEFNCLYTSAQPLWEGEQNTLHIYPYTILLQKVNQGNLKAGP